MFPDGPADSRKSGGDKYSARHGVGQRAVAGDLNTGVRDQTPDIST